MSYTGSARLKTASGLVVALVGLSALAGWGTGQRLISSIRADYIPMAPNTAVGFLLLGIALVAMPGNTGACGGRWPQSAPPGSSPAWRVSSWWNTAFRSTWAFTTGSFTSPPSGSAPAPVGKMALSTALAFALASLAAVLCAISPRQPTLDCAGLMGLAVMTLGLVFGLGYLYAAPLFYGGPAIPMALNTAAAFAVLGLGLIGAAGPAALPLRPFVGTSVRAQLLRAFLPFTVLIVLVSDWLTQAVAWFAPPRRWPWRRLPRS